MRIILIGDEARFLVYFSKKSVAAIDLERFFFNDTRTQGPTVFGRSEEGRGSEGPTREGGKKREICLS